MTNFRLCDEQMVNRLRKIAWASVSVRSLYISMFKLVHVSMSPSLHVSMSPCLYLSMFPCLHASRIPQIESGSKRKAPTSVCFLQMENGNGKLLFVCCKQKWKMDICFPWSANGRQTIYGKRRMLFQQTCPSMASSWQGLCKIYSWRPPFTPPNPANFFFQFK